MVVKKVERSKKTKMRRNGREYIDYNKSPRDVSSPLMNSISDGEGPEENSTTPKFLNVVRISCLKFSDEHIQYVFFHFHNAVP